MNSKIFLFLTVHLILMTIMFLCHSPDIVYGFKSTASPNQLMDSENSSNDYNSGISVDSDNVDNFGVECGQVITKSVTLSSNLNCISDGLIIGADRITINLDGFTITGPGDKSNLIGIMFANNDGVVIQGPGTIKNFQAGMSFSGGDTGRVSDITMTGNEIGVFGTGSTNLFVENNLLLDNDIGIAIHSTSDSKFNLNIIKSNELAGLTVVNSSGIEISGNTIEGSVNGIFMDGNSSENRVTSNSVTQNRGVDLNNANGLKVNDNNNIFVDNTCNTSVPDGLCL